MKYKLIIFFIIIIKTQLMSQNSMFEKINSYLNNLEIDNKSEMIFISIKKQKLYYMKNKIIIQEYIISSAELGVGNVQGSNKTPLGLHKIKQKFGEETPENGRMIGRVFYGEISNIIQDTSISKTDDITSRILWLDGQEKGYNKGGNVDSYNRYIYIHGTSEEGRIGIPSSHGCIRMKNKDIIELYDKIKIGTLVLIL